MFDITLIDRLININQYWRWIGKSPLSFNNLAYELNELKVKFIHEALSVKDYWFALL